jgi:hypothetical protein
MSRSVVFTSPYIFMFALVQLEEPTLMAVQITVSDKFRDTKSRGKSTHDTGQTTKAFASYPALA